MIHTIGIAEGIETGSAVALALQAEILAGKIAVVAAITAGGVEAIQIYPATQRVTIAADRDEAIGRRRLRIECGVDTNRSNQAGSAIWVGFVKIAAVKMDSADTDQQLDITRRNAKRNK